jgi:hypothetical protein
MRAFLVASIAWFAVLTAVSIAHAELKVGFAERDITPDISKPVYIAGYGQNRIATGVHDPLFARAVVLDDGNQKIALVCVDLVGLQHPEVLRIRQKLKGFLYVMVSSTHNHEGPDVIGIWGPTPIKSGVDPKYIDLVVSKCAEAVNEAADHLTPVDAAFGEVKDHSLLRDSRQPVVYDDVTRVLRFNAPGTTKPVGILVQVNNHPESLGSDNTQITADFPWSTVKALREKYDCPVAYFTGTVGGLMSNPPEIPGPDGKPIHDENFAFAEYYGRQFAKICEQAIENATPTTLTPFAVAAKTITAPLENPGYQMARKIGVLPRAGRVWTGDFETVGAEAEASTPADKLAIETEIACLRLGEVHVALIPGEIYPELVYGGFQDPVDAGADYPDAPLETPVMKMLPGEKKMLIGLANDEIGYIIPRRQWDHVPPFAYGRKDSQYGEVNSCGSEIAPILMKALENRVKELKTAK